MLSCSSTRNVASTDDSVSVEEVVEVQEQHNAIVVVNTANWCGTCKKHGQRVEEEIISQFNSDDRYSIVVNDLSTDETKASSQSNLEAAGLPNFAKENNGTGLIYFINADTKKITSKISVSKSTEVIVQAFEDAIIG